MSNWWSVFWKEEDLNLDLILVPTGILFLVAYHVYLFVRIKRYPNSTVIGFENGNRRDWVKQVMQTNSTSTALSVLSNCTSAATYMISLSVTLSSLIGTVVGSGKTSETEQKLIHKILYGDSSQLTASIKYASLMLCFLVAFVSHVQSLRYNLHATFLISTPNTAVPVRYVEDAVVKGSNYWNTGLRALYVSFPLLLWIFGPVPMFMCCLGMITFMYFMDSIPDPIAPFGTYNTNEKSKTPSPQIPLERRRSVGFPVVPPPMHPPMHSTHKMGAILFGAQAS